MTIRAQNLSMKVSICKEKKEEGFRLFLIPFDCCRSIILCVVKSPHFLQKAKSNFLFSQNIFRFSFLSRKWDESFLNVSFHELACSRSNVPTYCRSTRRRVLAQEFICNVKMHEGQVLTNDCREKESEIRVNTQGKHSQSKTVKKWCVCFCCVWLSNQQFCWDRMNKFSCRHLNFTVEVI